MCTFVSMINVCIRTCTVPSIHVYNNMYMYMYLLYWVRFCIVPVIELCGRSGLRRGQTLGLFAGL